MAQTDFIEQLKQLGLDPKDRGNGRISFEYTVPVGKFYGEKVELGFEVPADFPLNPPSGPHVSPRLLPLNNTQGVPHPAGGIHESKNFGATWEYLSRPFPEWKNTDRTVRAYMAHIRGLFATQ